MIIFNFLHRFLTEILYVRRTKKHFFLIFNSPKQTITILHSMVNFMEKVNETIRQHDTELTKHETEIKNLSDIVLKMDKKIDTINENINKMNSELVAYTSGVDKEVNRINNELHDEINKMSLKIHEDTFDVDRRVTALESQINTLKWVIATLTVVFTSLQFFINYLH